MKYPFTPTGGGTELFSSPPPAPFLCSCFLFFWATRARYDKVVSTSGMTELKTVVVGDTDVGKTSLAARFVHGILPQVASPTIGASFLQKRVVVGGCEEIVLQIWDTAGQERFRAMAPMYYRHARIAVLVLDVSKPPLPIEKLDAWRQEIKAHAAPDVTIVVAGNKSDLDASSLPGLKEVCNSLQLPFFLTSALSGDGVDDLFNAAIQEAVDVARRKVVNEMSGEHSIEEIDKTARVVLGTGKKDARSGGRGGCC